jgi:hypothetical protein
VFKLKVFKLNFQLTTSFLNLKPKRSLLSNYKNTCENGSTSLITCTLNGKNTQGAQSTAQNHVAQVSHTQYSISSLCQFCNLTPHSQAITHTQMKWSIYGFSWLFLSVVHQTIPLKTPHAYKFNIPDTKTVLEPPPSFILWLHPNPKINLWCTALLRDHYCTYIDHNIK